MKWRQGKLALMAAADSVTGRQRQRTLFVIWQRESEQWKAADASGLLGFSDEALLYLVVPRMSFRNAKFRKLERIFAVSTIKPRGEVKTGQSVCRRVAEVLRE